MGRGVEVGETQLTVELASGSGQKKPSGQATVSSHTTSSISSSYDSHSEMVDGIDDHFYRNHNGGCDLPSFLTVFFFPSFFSSPASSYHFSSLASTRSGDYCKLPRPQSTKCVVLQVTQSARF